MGVESSGSGAGGGGATLIAKVGPLLVAAPTIDFAGIPPTSSHLRLIIVARSDAAAAEDFINLTFNGDTAAHYDYEQVNISAATVGGNPTNAAAKIGVLSVAGATAEANAPGTVIVDIPHYTATTFFKTVQAVAGFSDSVNTTQRELLLNGLWRSTAAIVRVTLNLNSAGPGNFVIGSVAYLYGIG